VPSSAGASTTLGGRPWTTSAAIRRPFSGPSSSIASIVSVPAMARVYRRHPVDELGRMLST
jgi:hypothetical protein